MIRNLSFLWIVLTLCGCMSNKQIGENSPIIPRSILFGNPERSGVRVSQNGKYLTYLANKDGVRNVFIASIDNPNEALPITNDTNRGIQQYFWLHDNQHVAYLKDDGGDENWRIHVVDIRTKEDKVFTPAKVKAVIYKISEEFPDEIIIGLNDRNPAFHDIYRLNILNGQKTLIFKNDGKFYDFVFDYSYNLRFAATSTKGGGAAYYMAEPSHDKKNYTWKLFLKADADDFYTTEILKFTKDGNTLYVLDSRNRDINLLKEFNLKDHSEKVLAEGKKADICDAIITHAKTGVIQACTTNYLRKEWMCLDNDFAVHLKQINQTIKGDLEILSKTNDDNLWIIAEIKDDGPIGYYLYSKAEKKLTFLFNNRDSLNDYQLAKMECVVIKARDGLDLPAYMTRPLNISGSTPLVLVVHGGPVARDEWGYDPEAQWLANRGYTVLQVNYRASTGFGKSFISKGNCEWGRKMHEDLLDAVKWAKDKGIANTDKIAIYGLSYGGYAALWGATNSGDIFKCAVDGFGRSNLQNYFERIPAYWQPNIEQLYRRIGDPRTKEGMASLKERSPLTHVSKLKIPVLIAHGEKDSRVKQVESEEIVSAMKEKNLPYIYMLFMDEGHGFARPENRLAFYSIVESFLADNLGGSYQAITSELDNTTLKQEHKEYLKNKK